MFRFYSSVVVVVAEGSLVEHSKLAVLTSAALTNTLILLDKLVAFLDWLVQLASTLPIALLCLQL